jgi:S1-C subfamily serine protease
MRLLCCAALLLVPSAALRAADDVDELQEQTIKAAVKRVAPCVVQIETSGGQDVIHTGPPGRGGQIRKGTGPTTGLVVGADGFVITSAFNFANKPQKIFVSVPGNKERFVAEVHATDFTRMLTLLKIEAKDLPVPEPSPKKDIAIGQTAIALGRTLDPLTDHSPSVSVGIISALNRIWGKAFQTDCKVSPANYGGPLIDLQGRVIGVLVPASPLAEDETAGVEWYDSGIGFAVPLEDVNKVLPKLRQKKDLRKGLLGITPQGQDIYSALPVVGSVAPGSAAERAGIKAGARVLEIDGHEVYRHAQVRHLLGPHYEDDEISIKFQNDKEEPKTAKVALTANVEVATRAYLGILPMRDDPELGVEIRHVFAGSPADTAKLKPGDRITQVGRGNGKPQPFFNGQVSGRDQLAGLLATQRPGTELKFEVKRKEGGKNEEVTVKLGEWKDELPAEPLDPKLATFKKALEPRKTFPPQPPAPPKKDDKKDDKKPEDGFQERSNPSGDHKYYLYVPDSPHYDPQTSYALIVWLHPIGKGKPDQIKDLKSFWEGKCDKNNWILACPKAENDTGWIAGEADFIREMVDSIRKEYTIDPHRIVIHGMGQGGEMAFYLGFHARDLFRAVVTTGAALRNQVKPPVPNEPLAFFIAVGDKDPSLPDVRDTKAKLDEQKYPVTYREVKDLGHQYLNDEWAEPTWLELLRWLDCLDRM